MAMKFLELVAQDLLQTFGNNLSGVTVVIPGKRARLFMNQYLAMLSEKPVWSPQYQTIDELFLELSPYKKADQIESVCLLYKIYSQLVDNPEPLDEFYSWGEIILSDFDDLDKHRAPADKVFANVHDLHAIQEIYITEQQAEALRSFFKNFTLESNTELKRRFLRLWEIMPKMYDRLRQELMNKGYLYAGALYRDVVDRYEQATKHGGKETERTKLAEMQQHTYAFVGFNVVDECEEALFKLLGTEHTRFYWDYDEMYINDVYFKIDEPGEQGSKRAGAPWEAGLFLRNNLRNFPNSLPREYFNNLHTLTDITFVATSTDNAQARYLPKWINEHLTDPENDTAIVLCDEHMLQPVMHSLPEDKPESINITMGFPLTDTPIYSFLSIFTAMQIDGWDHVSKRFRETFVQKVKRHPYYEIVKDTIMKEDKFLHMDDNLSLLQFLQNIITELGSYYAQKISENNVYDQLYSESLYQAHKVTNRFITLIEEGTLDVHPITLRRLVRNVLSTTSIPFHGEPAIGMQVMGLMETRNLDFSNLLMLNVGEGTMPKKSDDNSLIPFPIRDAYGLTTIRHRISVFAYYFFRLLQRTKHVTLMYNENSSGIKNNEMSRFMRQLMAETNLPIRHIRLTPENEPFNTQAVVKAEKTAKMLQALQQKYRNKPLSPTAFNAYLNCPLQFYFKYIAGLYMDRNESDEITAAEMGNIFHNAAEDFYNDLFRKYNTHTITAEMIRPFLEHKETQLAKYIKMGDLESKSGLPLIIHNVILEYLCQLLRYDIKHAPFTIKELETDYTFHINIAKEGEPPINLKIGGRVDRLDSNERGLVVVDYKTGGLAEAIDSIQAIFDHKAKNAGYYFQTILYSLAVSHQHHCAVQPTLFYVHRAYDATGYDSSLSIKTGRSEREVILDVRSIEETFTQMLKDTLHDLFNPNLCFTQTQDEQKCKYCDYIKLCGKKKKTY